MTPAAQHVRVSGRVQGVFFRQSAAEMARGLGVAGWVRNLPDGSVEAHVEGETEAVGAMLRWLHRGPPAASVERVESREAQPQQFDGFEVRR